MERSTDPALLDLFTRDGSGGLDPALREQLLDAIEGLEPQMRDLVNGVFWEQMSIQRVAFRLGIDPAEAPQLLQEAFDAIRTAVQVPEQVGAVSAADLGSGPVPVPQPGSEGPGVPVR